MERATIAWQGAFTGEGNSEEKKNCTRMFAKGESSGKMKDGQDVQGVFPKWGPETTNE